MTEPAATPQPALPAWAPWAIGAAAGLLVLGPGLAPGGLFNLDLVVPHDVPVPRGVWGLGPELPRRVPLWLPMAWLSPVLSAALVTKVVLVAAIAAAVAGAWRLTGEDRWLTGAGAGLLYGLSPFLLTRAGVGHLMVVVAMGMLPWAVGALVRPERSLAATFLWGVALSLTGFFGGTVVGLVVAVGLIAGRGRRLLPVLAVTVASQALWLVPSLVVQLGGGGADLSGARAFRTQARGPWGLAHVLAGHGFWQPPFQVGWPEQYDVSGPVGWPVSVAGAVLVVLAIAGTSRLPDGLGRRLAGLAAVGFAIVVAATLPGVWVIADAITATALGAPFREPQRYLLLYLVWVAPAAALGARRLAERLARARSAWRAGAAGALGALPLALAVVLAGPGLLGVKGALEPRDLPGDWATVRSAVAADPGPVVALPWELYLDVPLEGGERRRLLNPLPIYLGGDVITSSDPRLGGTTQERADPRERAIDQLAFDLRSDVPDDGTPPSFGAGVGDLGFRWVVLFQGADAGRYATLADDPDLEHVVDGATIDLWEVRSWPGAITTTGGEALDAAPLLEPLVMADAGSEAVWRRPWQRGWLRGAEAARRTPDGLIALPAGAGPVWFWPSALVMVTDLAIAVACVAILRRRRRTDARTEGEMLAPPPDRL